MGNVFGDESPQSVYTTEYINVKSSTDFSVGSSPNPAYDTEPVIPTRGKGLRGRGRGKGKGRGRGRSKSTLLADEGQDVQPNTQEQNQEFLKAEFSTLTRDDLLRILFRVVEVEPGVLLYAMRPSARPEGGYHPDPSHPAPDWCSCGFCRQMPTVAERVCCKKHQCVSRTPRFESLILDEGVLALGRLLRRDILVYPDEDLGEAGDNINKANRYYAYTQYTLWAHGKLGAGNRVPVPACAVWRIRDKFPDPYGQYKGFIPARI